MQSRPFSSKRYRDATHWPLDKTFDFSDLLRNPPKPVHFRSAGPLCHLEFQDSSSPWVPMSGRFSWMAGGDSDQSVTEILASTGPSSTGTGRLGYRCQVGTVGRSRQRNEPSLGSGARPICAPTADGPRRVSLRAEDLQGVPSHGIGWGKTRRCCQGNGNFPKRCLSRQVPRCQEVASRRGRTAQSAPTSSRFTRILRFAPSG